MSKYFPNGEMAITMEVKTEIIPLTQHTYELPGLSGELDLKSICAWLSIGFFLNDRTFFNNKRVCKPGHYYSFDEQGYVKTSEKWFNWHYTPQNLSFQDTVERFAGVFEKTVNHGIKNSRVILPLSGGLDSRSIAAGIEVKNTTGLFSFSYEFENARITETTFARKIAQARSFDFAAYKITPSFFWDKIDLMASINGAYGEFTRARAMAVLDKLTDRGDVFLLGHMGDLLFNKTFDGDKLTADEAVELMYGRLVKKSGYELGEKLWTVWQLSGRLDEYLRELIREGLEEIDIEHPSARLRAYKTNNWVSRWTAVNLRMFSYYKPVFVPYFNEALIDFACSTSEEYLNKRAIQIEYIRRKSPDLAKIPWQPYYPYNLYDYGSFFSPKNYPRRLYRKVMDVALSFVGNSGTDINWQLQFTGNDNLKHIENYLQKNKEFREYVPAETVSYFVEKFLKGQQKIYWFSLAMLITFAAFFENNRERNL